MSSYITGHIIMEEHRLQKIVDLCAEELDRALQKVQEQEEYIKQEKERQKAEDAAYLSDREEEKNKYRKRIQDQESEFQSKKKKLTSMLKGMDIELSVFQRKYQDGLNEALRREKELWRQLETGTEDLEGLEKRIHIHIQETEKEMQQIVSESVQIAYTNVESEQSYQNRKIEKGVSLKGIDRINSNYSEEYTYQSPADLFRYKMQTAIESAYSDRFPSLFQLMEEFNILPDYAKDAFAVRNMEKVEEYLKQFESAEEYDRQESEKREQEVAKYVALCKLLEKVPEEGIISDVYGTRKIAKKCNELLKQYEEAKKQEYIAESVANVMEKHGIVFQEFQNTSEGGILHLSMKNLFIDVSGMERDLLTVEVAGEYSGTLPTLEDRRRGISSANHFCSLMEEIEEELKEEYGILFRHTLRDAPDEKNIAMYKREGRPAFKEYKKSKAEYSLGEC